MPRYEYKVVPAPKKAGKVKGVKGTEARFAHELATLMNRYGADGWEYQRTDTLPCEERSGLTGRTTVFQNMLVFRRATEAAEAPTADAIAAAHVAEPPAPAPAPEPVETAAPEPVRPPEPVPFRAAPPADAAPEPAGDEPVSLPAFRSASHAPAEEEEPVSFTSRTQEGRTPRLGAARHPEPNGKKAPGLFGR
ncbi:DUF4177 domain-containing protein [Psychromarinibacter sediminicola]|uniref:DUF4177 domain-containing protein n=1 Tax=Psychromarinibacter sediminicola TaxID=3033385 RepID=UPI0035AB9B1F